MRVIRLEDLQEAAWKVRHRIPCCGTRVRRRPRDPEKARALFERAVWWLYRYPPQRNSNGSIVLPYFWPKGDAFERSR